MEHQRASALTLLKIPPKNKELIWKYKAAVVGRCGICFGVSSLYLEAAYLRRSSAAGKSLSSPFPAALTSRCQPTSPIQLLGGSPRPPAALRTSAAARPTPCISGAGVLPKAQPGGGTRACRPPTSMQRAAFSFSGSRCVRRAASVRERAIKSGEASEACDPAHSSDPSVPPSRVSEQMPAARK